MSRLSRQEMKRDEVREVLSGTLRFVSENLKLVGIVVGGVIVAIVVWLLVADTLTGREERASDLLASALEIADAPLASEVSAEAPAGRVFPDEAARQDAEAEALRDVVEKFSKSDAARIARATLARIAYERGDVEAARQGWNGLATAGPKDALRAEAELNLIHLDRATGEAARAEERLIGMRDSGEAALPPDVVLRELAVTQRQLGKSEESRVSYRRLLEEYPSSPYAAEARQETADTAASADSA